MYTTYTPSPVVVDGSLTARNFVEHTTSATDSETSIHVIEYVVTRTLRRASSIATLIHGVCDLKT